MKINYPQAPSLIEHVLPVAKVSAESYKERKSGSGQRLTGIGKWWGRKPLVLVRACILGSLLPATGDDEKDIEVFERLMSMDKQGLFERRNGAKNMSFEAFSALSPAEQLKMARLAEDHMGPSDEQSWAVINAHLETNASNLQELVEQLGVKRFGHKPKVGDVFSGGGSIPFEAARLGCDTYASDLNPVAALLTWSNQALLCATPEDKARIDAAQSWVYSEVDRQITEWGIEHDERGRRADAYLWCNEVLDPETGYRVPLAATWIISVKDKVVAELIPDHTNKRYDIRIITNASDEQMAKAKKGTVVDQKLIPPPTPAHPEPHPTDMSQLRDNQNNGQGLRHWTKEDLTPQPDDFFQERLYCVRWLEVQEKGRVKRSYEAATDANLEREEKCLTLLKERFTDWQTQGFIPAQQVQLGGVEVDKMPRMRGWTHWHHLFKPRQLLTNGLFAEAVSRSEAPRELLGLVGRVANHNARLSGWNPAYGADKVTYVFTGQALTPMYNGGTRGFTQLQGIKLPTNSLPSTPLTVNLHDARTTNIERTIWITDPPYADAVAYEEISEFFLAWYDKRIPKLFPEWYADSKRALALKGKGQSFNEAMVEIYSNLASHMPDNGVQIVMFTHQDPKVWADLGMTMWASGLKITAAWTVATETTDGLKGGTNSVQGTVLMVLRKRDQNAPSLYDDEAIMMMNAEVERQLQKMQALETSGLQWTDADLIQSMYVAALRVLTAHNIKGINPKEELLRVRPKGEKSEVQKMLEHASKSASGMLKVRGIDKPTWDELSAHERFYLKALETEQRGEQRNSTYQELARSLAAQNWQEVKIGRAHV